MSVSAHEQPRVALVTGAAGGLGAALVNAFLGAGWRVAAAGHRGPPAVPASGERALALRLDVTRAEDSAAAVDRIVSRWGRLDALVNNAGITRDAPLPRMHDQAWQEVMDVNLKGAFLCARAAVPRMTRGGHIINIGSHSACAGHVGQANYAAAKAALCGLTLSLARELGPSGICVNAVLPGVMPTGMTSRMTGEELRPFVHESVLGRINTTEEVARMIVHLAESRHVSGQVWPMDGRIPRWC